MVKELERLGLPAVHACSITTISKTVGANRILPTVAIPHPFGDPAMSREQEIDLRIELLRRAFVALSTAISKQTFF